MYPNTLFVSWHNWVPSYVRNEIKKKMGVAIDEKGNVIEKTDNEEEPKLTQQQQQNKDQKQYTSIKSYKPSVYGEDLLAKVEKKISFGV